MPAATSPICWDTSTKVRRDPSVEYHRPNRSAFKPSHTQAAAVRFTPTTGLGGRGGGRSDEKFAGGCLGVTLPITEFPRDGTNAPDSYATLSANDDRLCTHESHMYKAIHCTVTTYLRRKLMFAVGSSDAARMPVWHALLAAAQSNGTLCAETYAVMLCTWPSESAPAYDPAIAHHYHDRTCHCLSKCCVQTYVDIQMAEAMNS